MYYLAIIREDCSKKGQSVKTHVTYTDLSEATKVFEELCGIIGDKHPSSCADDIRKSSVKSEVDFINELLNHGNFQLAILSIVEDFGKKWQYVGKYSKIF